jgi:hypothetical protein
MRNATAETARPATARATMSEASAPERQCRAPKAGVAVEQSGGVGPVPW